MTQLPESFGKLANLTKLYVYNNQLTQLPESLGKLANLTKLYVNNNKLTQLPESFGKLANLTELNVHNNKLTQLPESFGKLANLTKLYVYNNQLTQLPESLGKLANLKLFNLKINKFEFGAEIYELPPSEQIQEILKWQKANAANLLQPIHEAKVIFIGQSNYGKTHLIELLREGKIKRKITTTHGIERSKIDVAHPDKPIQANLWDLGGQEFMRSTHQFFFSERTLYVLVTLARTERNELNHWLELVNQLGNNAPVLVVINKIDVNPHDLDRESLRRDYPNIVGFVRTCIKDCGETNSKASIQNLRQQISAIICDRSKMPAVFERRRPEWFTVKAELEKLEKDGKDYISFEEYEQLEHIRDLPEEERKSNLKLLSILGTVVSYVNDTRLIDTNVINPQWILDGVYAIINDRIIKDTNKGVFNIKELARVFKGKLKRFPKVKHWYLLDLLQNFKLLYPAKNDPNTFFIPDLFEDVEPTVDWKDEGALMHFRYNYDGFSPDNFMTRFIVEKHGDIVANHRWRSGVYISNNYCQAKVYQSYRKNYINVEIKGDLKQRRYYLYSIREAFRELHSSFKSLKIVEEINYKGYWMGYQKLERFEVKNKPFYHDELDEDLTVTEILNGYSSPEQRETEQDRMLRDLGTQMAQVKNLISFGLTQNTAIDYPNIFTIKPKDVSKSEESSFNTLYDLQLFCAHKDCVHPVGDAYEVKIPKEWLQKITPYVNNVILGLQMIAPMIVPVAHEVLGAASFTPKKYTLKAMQEYINKLGPIGNPTEKRAYERRAANESEMQTIKSILDAKDSEKKWMSLLSKITHEGELLWVCPQHAREYD